jgi:hypothetical protein
LIAFSVFGGFDGFDALTLILIFSSFLDFLLLDFLLLALFFDFGGCNPVVNTSIESSL